MPGTVGPLPQTVAGRQAPAPGSAHAAKRHASAQRTGGRYRGRGLPGARIAARARAA
jgi:hypothetical protein